MHSNAAGDGMHRSTHSVSNNNNNNNNNRADEDAQEVWVQELWLRHCSAIADSVHVHDATVHHMWDLFQPLLHHLPLVPVGGSLPTWTAPRAVNRTAAPHPHALLAGSTEDDEDTSTSSSRRCITHVLVLDLRSAAAADDVCGAVSACLTRDMRVALHEQPTITLCLLEFFAAVMHVQQCEQQQQQQQKQPQQKQTQSSAVLEDAMTRVLRATTPRKSSDAFVAPHKSQTRGDYHVRRSTPNAEHAKPASHDTNSNTNNSSGIYHREWLGALASALQVYVTVLGDPAHSAAFDHVGAAQLDSLITLKGTIVRLSPPRIVCTHIVYRCDRCGAEQSAATPDGVLVYPNACRGRCRGYRWTPQPARSICEEVQTLKLQENVDFFVDAAAAAETDEEGNAMRSGGASTSASGGMNKVMEVHLRVPLMNCATVGDSVCVCGVLRCRREERRAGGSGAQQLCLHARSVVGSSARQGGGGAASGATTLSTTMMRIMRTGSGGGGDYAQQQQQQQPHWLNSYPNNSNYAIASNSMTSCVAQNELSSLSGSDGQRRSSTQQTGANTTPFPSHSAPPAHTITSPFSSLSASNPHEMMLWSAQDSALFYELARHPRWFGRLVASVAPGLYGLEMVKQAILLAVVGGSTQKLGTRSNIHLLLLGDPGLGKSQLLRAACAVAPRSAFVCAHTASSCGLTLTLTRDPVTGEASFAAGAVVHGDGGVTCIDEIDKGASEHKALLEVMESERVSMAKAGSVFSMPVHTSVLAAGNPVGGRFDLSKSMAANVNMSLALLSRFDIVVCLRDSPLRSSENLTSHVLQLHRRPGYTNADGNNSKPFRTCRSPCGAFRSATGALDEDGGDAEVSPLPHELVQRFVFFCKTQCQPILRVEACEILKAHYMHERARMTDDVLRARGGGMELPVTPRYLQALIRVSEARAKVDLRHEVTREDARYAVTLLQSCLQTLEQEEEAAGTAMGFGVGGANSSRSGGGGGGGGVGRKKSQRDCVVDLLKADIVCNGGVNRLSHRTILAACEEAGCKNPSAMMHQLNEVGVLLQCGDKYTLRGV